MKKVIFYGFDTPERLEAVKALQEDGLIDIVAWIGVPEYGAPITHNERLLWERRYPRERYYGERQDLQIELYNECLVRFMEMESRIDYQQNDRFLYEYIDMFHIFVDEFSQLLLSTKVDAIIFTSIPHEGADFIIYNIAKKLGIKTVMFSQSLFPDRVFYMYEMEDYGDFKSMPEQENCEHISIPRTFEKEIFYMKNLDLKWGTSKNISWNTFYYLYSRARHVLGILLAEDRRKALFETALMNRGNYLERQYRQNLQDTAVTSQVLDSPDVKYVYFPLHLQPELTTSALGGYYADQVLAIEMLSKFLPPDWKIYAKENPKQEAYRRSPSFFDRIKCISNVELIAPDVSTYALLKDCQFVATVTGTAGWEAITGGKNVLVFGLAWYKNLPGVFSWSKCPDLQEILDYKIDHGLLEQAFSRLLGKAAAGVIDPVYKEIVPDFSEEANNKKVYDLLAGLLAD